MICPNCQIEVYKYRTFVDNGKLISQCYSCSHSKFPGLSTIPILIDQASGLTMSPAEYHYVTHLVIGEGGVPYEDKTGRLVEKTLIGKLKQKLPN